MTGKLLIVDDSATDRLIIKNMLSDFNLITAENGREAMRLIREQPDIDLIILDLNMPVMNGFEVLNELKDINRNKRMRAIILTNYDELDNEIRGLQAGAVDFIRKPINLESLRLRISIHLELLQIQKLYEQTLYERNLTLDTLLNQAPIGIALSHGENPNSDGGEKTIFNEQYQRITGRTRDELIQLGWAKITHPEDLVKEEELYRRFKAGEIESYKMEKRFVRPDGSIVWADVTVAQLNIIKETELNHICLVQDISDRKEKETQLKHISEIDSLTKLHNRRYLANILTEDMKAQTEGTRAIVLLSLRKINVISLSYGYNFCEEIMVDLAASLSGLADEHRQLFQISFERFAFYITKYENEDELKAFSQKVLDLVDSYQILRTVGCGIGIVQFDCKDGSIENIIRNASTAAERSDRDQNFGYRFFNKEMEAAMKREADVKEALVRAVDGALDERLYLQFQPILNLKNNKVEEFEALARFESQTIGRVSPLEFISIAEETQLIVPLGKRVIEMACAFQKRLQDAGYHNIRIFVNASAIQLLRNEFIDEFLDIVRQYGLRPEQFGLEVTESVFAGSFNVINDKLEKLMEIGVKTSIDDFGTGYSTLERERDMKINVLKIDKTFIDGLLHVKREKSITRDIIAMAHRMGHAVIAEGVEHDDQKQYLLDFNCDMMQGYLFSKPLDEDAAIGIVAQYGGSR